MAWPHCTEPPRTERVVWIKDGRMHISPFLAQCRSEALYDDLTVALQAQLLGEPAHEVRGEVDTVSADES